MRNNNKDTLFTQLVDRYYKEKYDSVADVNIEQDLFLWLIENEAKVEETLMELWNREEREFSKSEMESSLEILMERIEKIEQEQKREEKVEYKAEQKQEHMVNDRKIDKKKQVRKCI